MNEYRNVRAKTWGSTENDDGIDTETESEEEPETETESEEEPGRDAAGDSWRADRGVPELGSEGDCPGASTVAGAYRT